MSMVQNKEGLKQLLHSLVDQMVDKMADKRISEEAFYEFSLRDFAGVEIDDETSDVEEWADEKVVYCIAPFTDGTYDLQEAYYIRDKVVDLDTKDANGMYEQSRERIVTDNLIKEDKQNG